MRVAVLVLASLLVSSASLISANASAAQHAESPELILEANQVAAPAAVASPSLILEKAVPSLLLEKAEEEKKASEENSALILEKSAEASPSQVAAVAAPAIPATPTEQSQEKAADEEAIESVAEEIDQLFKGAADKLHRDMNKMEEARVELQQEEQQNPASTLSIEVDIPAANGSEVSQGVLNVETQTYAAGESQLEAEIAEDMKQVEADVEAMFAALQLENETLNLRDDFTKAIHEQFFLSSEDEHELQQIKTDVEKLHLIEDPEHLTMKERELHEQLNKLHRRIKETQPETICHLANALKIENDIIKCGIPDWKPKPLHPNDHEFMKFLKGEEEQKLLNEEEKHETQAALPIEPAELKEVLKAEEIKAEEMEKELKEEEEIKAEEMEKELKEEEENKAEIKAEEMEKELKEEEEIKAEEMEKELKEEEENKAEIKAEEMEKELKEEEEKKAESVAAEPPVDAEMYESVASMLKNTPIHRLHNILKKHHESQH